MADSDSSNAPELVNELKAQLRAYQQNVKVAMFRALTFVQASAKANLGGKVLQVRTGLLRNSIFKDVITEADGSVTGVVGSQGVKYAAINEFGGKTKPHRIEPKNGKFLKFAGRNGGTVFSKGVNHPGSVIPERSYLRAAFKENEDKILQEFGSLLVASFPEKG